MLDQADLALKRFRQAREAEGAPVGGSGESRKEEEERKRATELRLKDARAMIERDVVFVQNAIKLKA